MVIFAAATGLRPAEWLALERRDVDREPRVVYVRRSFTKGRLKCTKTEASQRAVPLQAIALDAVAQQPSSPESALLFPAERGGYLDLHNFRNREWKPAQRAAGIEPLRRIYDLRHTFATFALRAGISTFDLSRYMGASLTMIDRHYGHLARDGREHAIRLTDSNRRPPPYHGGFGAVDRARIFSNGIYRPSCSSSGSPIVIRWSRPASSSAEGWKKRCAITVGTIAESTTTATRSENCVWSMIPACSP
jgi:hypothetical protein